MDQKIRKGEPGYLDREKKSKRLLLAGFVFVIAALLVTASAIGGTVGGFIRMAGVLIVIPAANTFVNVVAMAPYRSGGGRLAELARSQAPGCPVLSELVITNTDGPSVSVPCAVVGQEAVLVLRQLPEKKEKALKHPIAREFAAYLERRLRLSGVELRVECFDDEAAFCGALSGLSAPEAEAGEAAASALRANSF